MIKLSKDFVYLVLVGMVAALGVLTVACLTVGIQAWRAARSNPAEALRSE